MGPFLETKCKDCSVSSTGHTIIGCVEEDTRTLPSVVANQIYNIDSLDPANTENRKDIAASKLTVHTVNEDCSKEAKSDKLQDEHENLCMDKDCIQQNETREN